MTLVFQIVAIVAIAAAALYFVRGTGARHQALRRVLMLAFVAAAASSVFFPQMWTRVANLVGIGRGTDLLVYLLVLTFFGFVASSYRRFRQLEGDITVLARKLALMDEERRPES